MEKRLLDILCCPITRVAMRPAARAEIESINRAIGAGTVLNAGAAPVTRVLRAALITVDGSRIYPVVDDIPVLLADQAISTSQDSDFPNASVG